MASHLFHNVNSDDLCDVCGDRRAALSDGQPCSGVLTTERRRLIAQAPAMARLLLDMQWSGMHWDRSGGAVCCPSCTVARGGAAIHNADCELAAVLRAAGVLP